jgi:PleD family two-component response regulator
VLRHVGEILRALFSSKPSRAASAARFVVLLPGTAIEDASLAPRAAPGSSADHPLCGRSVPRVTISTIAAFPEAGSNLMDMLKLADAALYRAKQNGRNRVERASDVTVDPDCDAVADEAVASLGVVLAEAKKETAAVEPVGGKRKGRAA